MKEALGPFFPIFSGLSLILPILIAWSVIWKGIALWKSARLGHKGWFVALMIVNTLGILEIIYIYAVANKSETAHGQMPKA